MFSVTRNRFRNRKQLARKGVENSSEVVVFYRAPRVPRPIFKRSTGPRLFHLRLAPQILVFAHYRTQKRGKSCWIYPVRRLDSIQFFANKMSDLQFSFGSSERFLMIRLHKIWRYNTRFPAHQKRFQPSIFGAQPPFSNPEQPPIPPYQNNRQVHKNSPSFPLKPYTTLSRNTKPNEFHVQRQVAWHNLTLPPQQ